ncbi:MAG TPA: TlpA family protein disulfide reductase, partial [Thiotrichales bacterium]|nr:TlpA family protein disulfide reductase [Thiotrichales bacterium]
MIILNRTGRTPGCAGNSSIWRLKTPVLKKTLAAFLLLFCLCVTLQPVSAASLAPPFGIRHYAIGEAKNFLLEDIDGEPFSLDSTRGRWVFLHFWASWCGPCREEMPTIQRLSEKMAGKPLAIVLVNTAEEEDDVFTFLSGIEVELNSLRDKDGQ